MFTASEHPDKKSSKNITLSQESDSKSTYKVSGSKVIWLLKILRKT